MDAPLPPRAEAREKAEACLAACPCQEREAKQIKDIAIVRIEQLSPFPFDKVADELSKYPNMQKVVWAQEEPKNMGAWFFINPRIRTATRTLMGKVSRERERREVPPRETSHHRSSFSSTWGVEMAAGWLSKDPLHGSTSLQEIAPIYVGRNPAAAPATGMAKVHEKEQRTIIETALSPVE